MARRRPADLFDRLLDAATRVFADKGLSQARMSDVAQAMGVSQGTLYNLVESKEALFYLLMTRAAGEPPPAEAALPAKAPPMKAIVSRLETGIASGFVLPRLDEALAKRRVADAGAELEEIVRELYARMAETRRLADVIERSAVDLPPMFALFFLKVRRDLFGRLERYVRRRIEGGAFRRLPDAAIAARFLVESVVLFARHRHRDPDPQPMDEAAVVETLTSLLVSAFVPDRDER